MQIWCISDVFQNFLHPLTMVHKIYDQFFGYFCWENSQIIFEKLKRTLICK